MPRAHKLQERRSADDVFFGLVDVGMEHSPSDNNGEKERVICVCMSEHAWMVSAAYPTEFTFAAGEVHLLVRVCSYVDFVFGSLAV